MEPTWRTEDGAVQLYLGDCLEVLPTLEAGSVDAVVTDPPYEIMTEFGQIDTRKGYGDGRANGVRKLEFDWDKKYTVRDIVCRLEAAFVTCHEKSACFVFTGFDLEESLRITGYEKGQDIITQE